MTDVSAIVEAMARASDPLAFKEGSPLADPDGARQSIRNAIPAMLAALNLTEEQAAALADGSAVVVPVEPTPEQTRAGMDCHPAQSFLIVKDTYAAMLKARPQ